MKRFWRTWLAVVATTSIASSAIAQSNWNQPQEIGSYQSIMSRAGINQSGYDMGTTPGNGHIQDPQFSPSPHAAPPAYGSLAPGSGAPVGSAAPALPHAAAQVNPSCGANTGPVMYGPGGCAGQANYFDGGAIGGAGANAANWVLGTRVLFFSRSDESAVPLSRNAGGDVLLSTDNSYGTMPGGEISLIRRTGNNRGLELRYWGLYPSQRETEFTGGMLDTYLIGLDNFVVAPGAVNVRDYYNNATSHRIYRNNEIHNVEANLLRNGGTYSGFGGRNANFELLGGFRWFQFNEDYRFAAFDGAPAPARVHYDLETRNTLLGFQVGGRSELCLTDRISLLGGTRVGLFNNHSRSRQRICNEFDQLAYLDGGVAGVNDFNYSATRNNLAVLGEVDLGVACRITQRVRANVGYRLLGVNGIALAPNQIPRNFVNFGELNRVKANDSLILGGGYAGLEMCF